LTTLLCTLIAPGRTMDPGNVRSAGNRPLTLGACCVYIWVECAHTWAPAALGCGGFPGELTRQPWAELVPEEESHRRLHLARHFF
jgi:hypothetical protein